MPIVAYLKKSICFYNNQRKVIFLILMLFCVGVFFSSLIPPFQSPDEEDHLKRAYFLSQGRIAMETPVGQSTGGQIDTGLSEFIALHRYMAGNPQKKLTLDVQQKSSVVKWSGEEQFGPSPGVNYYFPFIYVPQAVGLYIGQVLDLTVSQSYYLARYTTLLSALIIIAIAFSMHRPSFFVVAILLMPLAIFQFVSTSQDGFAIALVVLAGSLFISITSKKAVFNTSHFYCMCGAILLLTTSRINLVPMLIMPLAATYTASKSIRHYLFSVLIILLSLVWIVYALATTVDHRIEREFSTVEILTYYIKDPIAFIKVLAGTLQDRQAVNFYMASFIGIMGWLDTSIGDGSIMLIFYSLLVIFLCSISIQSIKEYFCSRVILFMVAIASVLLTFFLLLITWTRHPADLIQGVQGRYFWASAILFGMALTVGVKNFSVPRKSIIFVALSSIIFVAIFIMPKTLLSRYFIAAKPAVSISAVVLKERGAKILPKDPLMLSEQGGFIDASEYKGGEIVISGWGYFDQDEKVFLSNYKESIDIKYITIERPDVGNHLGEDKFIYAGFSIKILAENEKKAKKIMRRLCLYSSHPIYGIKQFVSGESNKLYKCGIN